MSDEGGLAVRRYGGMAEAQDAGSVLPPYRLTALPPTALPPPIVAVSPAMRRAVDLARRFAASELPVLLVGATGTGKEVLAQAIHRWSGRAGPLVDVDCGAIAPGMVTNELFGHRRGAYTTAVESIPGLLEHADRGTLFLDELASLPAEGQAALLRVVETGEVRRVGDQAKHRVRVRLIAAVQDQVGRILEERRLRMDLYQRLAGTIIYLPPLTERAEDVWPMAEGFALALGRSLRAEGRHVLVTYAWPGNGRELRHVIARAASLQEAGTLSAETLAEAIDLGAQRVTSSDISLPGSDAEPNPLRAELERVCQANQGRTDDIAVALGISRATLYRRLQRFGMRLEEWREGEPGLWVGLDHRLTVSPVS